MSAFFKVSLAAQAKEMALFPAFQNLAATRQSVLYLRIFQFICPKNGTIKQTMEGIEIVGIQRVARAWRNQIRSIYIPTASPTHSFTQVSNYFQRQATQRIWTLTPAIPDKKTVVNDVTLLHIARRIRNKVVDPFVILKSGRIRMPDMANAGPKKKEWTIEEVTSSIRSETNVGPKPKFTCIQTVTDDFFPLEAYFQVEIRAHAICMDCAPEQKPAATLFSFLHARVLRWIYVQKKIEEMQPVLKYKSLHFKKVPTTDEAVEKYILALNRTTPIWKNIEEAHAGLPPPERILIKGPEGILHCAVNLKFLKFKLESYYYYRQILSLLKFISSPKIKNAEIAECFTVLDKGFKKIFLLELLAVKGIERIPKSAAQLAELQKELLQNPRHPDVQKALWMILKKRYALSL